MSWDEDLPIDSFSFPRTDHVIPAVTAACERTRCCFASLASSTLERGKVDEGGIQSYLQLPCWSLLPADCWTSHLLPPDGSSTAGSTRHFSKYLD